MSINQGNVWLPLFQFSDCFGGTTRNTGDADVLPAARELCCQQLSAHEVRIGDEDAEPPVGKL